MKWLLVFLFVPAVMAADKVAINGVAAMVDNEFITYGEMKARAWSEVEPLIGKYQGAELKQRLENIYSTVLDQLIESKLINLEFKAAGGEVTDAVLDSRVSDIIREKFDNDRTRLLAMLGAEGSSLDDWKKYVREQMIVSGMIAREIEAKIMIPPHTVRAEYERRIKEYELPPRFKIRLYTVDGTQPGNEVDKIAAALHGGLKAGDDLAKISNANPAAARLVREDDLGWVGPDDLRTEIQGVLKGLTAGSLSRVIKAGDNRYVVKVEGVEPGLVVPFEDAQKEIERDLRRKAKADFYAAWIARLKQKYHVTLNGLDAIL